MPISNNNKVIFVMLTVILLGCAQTRSSEVVIGDLNGNWVDDQQFLKGTPAVTDEQFSWGLGKSGNITVDIDVERNLVRWPLSGDLVIKSKAITADGTIQLEILSVSAEKVNKSSGGTAADLDKFIRHLEIHLVDANKFWFTCPEWVGEEQQGPDHPWYRLAGPKK